MFYLILLNFICFYSLQAQQFKTYKNEGLIGYRVSADSAIIVLKAYYKTAIAKKDTVQIIKSLISLSAFNRIHLNYGSAFKNSGEALFLAEEFRDTLLMAKAHEEFGVLNYLFKQDDLAGINFKKSYKLYKTCYDNKLIPMSYLYNAYYNLVLYYQRTSNKKMLKSYIDSCSYVAKKTNLNPLYNVYLNEKKASLCEWNKKPNVAIHLLKISIDTLEQLENNPKISNENKSFLIILYARLADIYRHMNQMELSKKYYEKSISIEDTKGEHTFYRAYVLQRYSELLYKQGHFQNAYNNILKARTINDNYLNPRNESTQGFLTIRNRYNDQLNKKNELLNSQKLELANKAQKLLRFRIFFFIVIFLVIILGLIIWFRIKFLKHQKEEENSKELLKIKNNELTINTLHLIEREKVIKLLSDHIKKSDLDHSTKALLKSIEKRSISLWDSFNNRFTSQNEGFYERLQEKAPNLSPADLKICALIKLNFSGKEMAYLLGISLGSVHVARHRLRKKMNLTRNKNLMNYINSI